MSEIDYGAVFGVDTGANEPAPAQQAPAEETPEPAAETATEETKPETAEDNAGEKETEPAAQSAEENAKFAAARRKAEQERDAAVAQAKAEAQRSLDDTIKSLGLTNSFTGQPINTKAEYDEWKRKETEQKKGEVAEAAGMNVQEFETFINNLPQVQEANRAAESARRQQQKMVLDEQIKEIGKLDPSIKSVEDLMKDQESYRAIYQKVQNGNSIVEAYKLVNFDKLTAAAGSAAKQAALNSANSKEHLTPTSARGAGAVPVPADVKAQYKLLVPNATDAEIQEHYNRFHKT